MRVITQNEMEIRFFGETELKRFHDPFSERLETAFYERLHMAFYGHLQTLILAVCKRLKDISLQTPFFRRLQIA